MSEESSHALLEPAHCCVLVLDLGCRDSVASSTQDFSQIETLLDATAEFEVPVYRCEWRQGRSDFLNDDDVLVRDDLNPWSDVRLTRLIEKAGCTKLILTGGCPEGSIVQGALSALAEGYDVYVLFDQLGGLAVDPHSIVAARLIQAGVVPVTTRELLLEWKTSVGRRSTDRAW